MYTTKLGYWLGRLGHVSGGPPKVSHFLGRACTGSLATKGRLLDRHVAADGMCTLCGCEYEPIVHAIFECPEVKSVWENSPMATHINDVPKESFFALFNWLRERLNKGELLRCVTMAWAC
ncbi:hypothetical protein RDABS01_016540 [Bienertia sinuspersici]